jgi:hypothetical protein
VSRPIDYASSVSDSTLFSTWSFSKISSTVVIKIGSGNQTIERTDVDILLLLLTQINELGVRRKVRYALLNALDVG